MFSKIWFPASWSTEVPGTINSYEFTRDKDVLRNESSVDRCPLHRPVARVRNCGVGTNRALVLRCMYLRGSTAQTHYTRVCMFLPRLTGLLQAVSQYNRERSKFEVSSVSHTTLSTSPVVTKAVTPWPRTTADRRTPVATPRRDMRDGETAFDLACLAPRQRIGIVMFSCAEAQCWRNICLNPIDYDHTFG